MLPVNSNKTNNENAHANTKSGLVRLIGLGIFGRSKKNNANESQEVAVTKNVVAGQLSEINDKMTAKLILPLRTKLMLVFGGLVTLFVLVGFLIVWLFTSINAEKNQIIVEQQRKSYLQNLQIALGEQQDIVSQSVLEGQFLKDASQQMETARSTIENNLYRLRLLPNAGSWVADIKSLELTYTSIEKLYREVEVHLAGGNFAAAETTRRIALPLDALLLSNLKTWSNEAGYSTSVLETMEQQQASKSWLLAGILLLEGICLALLIVLANRFVISPIGKLNVKLGQLLYSQTTRITERLNILENNNAQQATKLAAARHDLKLPLSNIHSLTQYTILCHNDLPTQAEQNLREIMNTAEASANMINSLLARQTGQLELAEVDLHNFINQLVELVDLREFNVHIHVEARKAVMDRQLIEHVLLNLLSNARKFSSGGIGIGSREVDTSGEIELWVWNDGELISAAEREFIFKPRFQSETGRQLGGHGLGLAIVHSLVQRHCGRVVVESHQKVGTTFRVFLPQVYADDTDD